MDARSGAASVLPQEFEAGCGESPVSDARFVRQTSGGCGIPAADLRHLSGAGLLTLGLIGVRATASHVHEFTGLVGLSQT
jgi:hypothetical protein